MGSTFSLASKRSFSKASNPKHIHGFVERKIHGKSYEPAVIRTFWQDSLTKLPFSEGILGWGRYDLPGIDDNTP